MASARTTSAYPAIFGSHGSSVLDAPGSRLGRKNQPSVKMTSTHTTPAHSKARKTLSPSVTKYSQKIAKRCQPEPGSMGLLADLQNGQESLLRNFDLPHLLHALLPGLLLLEELALAGDVAAVALGQHVFAHRLDAGPRNDMGTDRRLHGNVEHLPRDQLLHLVDQFPAAVVGIVAMDDERQRIDGIAVDQHIELDQGRRLKVAEFVIEGGIAAARRLEPIEEIEHDFGQGQFILQRHLAAEEQHFLLHPA